MSFFASLALTLGLYVVYRLAASFAVRADESSGVLGYAVLGGVLLFAGFFAALGYFGYALQEDVYGALVLALTLVAIRALERRLGWARPVPMLPPARELLAGVGLPWLLASALMWQQGMSAGTLLNEGVVRPLTLLGVLYLLNLFLLRGRSRG